MQGKSNLVSTTDDYFNLYVQNLTFYFYDLELDPMTFVLKLDLDMVVREVYDLELDPMTFVLKLDLDMVVREVNI